MKVLILGGTQFVGRHLVESALAAGHDITMFNRGRTAPELYPEVPLIKGDRERDLGLLRGHHWDAVVDTSGYTPTTVRASAEALADHADHYVFISTISVYAQILVDGLDESAPVAPMPDGAAEELGPDTYGPMKALCEIAVTEEMQGRCTIVRPGIIGGPFDPTDRFTYWVDRIARGGRVLLPRGPQLPMQVIDARDLADWTLDVAERKVRGTFNAVAPDPPATMGEWVTEMATVAGSEPEPVWVDESFLLGEGVQEWTDLPLWAAASNEPRASVMSVSAKRARSEGLTWRPLRRTIEDTLVWLRQRGDPVMQAGIDGATERTLLRKWDERR
jgi:2'-hydroxyisoflavone reductase